MGQASGSPGSLIQPSLWFLPPESDALPLGSAGQFGDAVIPGPLQLHLQLSRLYSPRAATPKRVHKGSSENDFHCQINLGHTGKVNSFLLQLLVAFHMPTCTATLQGCLGMDFLNLFGHRTFFERTNETSPRAPFVMGTQSQQHSRVCFELSGGCFMDEKTCPGPWTEPFGRT